MASTWRILDSVFHYLRTNSMAAYTALDSVKLESGQVDGPEMFQLSVVKLVSA